MKKFLLASALLVLSLSGCSSGERSVLLGQPDVKEGNLIFEERLMSATLVDGVFELRIPMGVKDGDLVKGSYSFEMKSLTTKWSDAITGDFSLQGNDSALVVRFNRAPVIQASGDEAAYVLDYRLTSKSGLASGTRSLFALLPKTDLVLMRSETVSEGEDGFVRVLLRNPMSGVPLSNRSVSMLITQGDKEIKTVNLVTDISGSAEFKLPAMVPGEYKVIASFETGDSTDTVDGTVTVVRDSKILVTLDKPMYQPGQKMFIRALALRKPKLDPEAQKELLFEIADGKGNKVFRSLVLTDDFGVAATQFQLAGQVNVGTYKIKATLGDVVTEKSVTVDRYKLPKFKLSMSMEEEWWKPGQKAKGMIKADYFFGKPVAGGTVSIQALRYDVEWAPFVVLDGKTDETGLYSFEFDLPEYLVGTTVDAGKATVLLEATVTDTAGQEVVASRELTVSKQAVELTVIPENEILLPGVPNRFYLFATDPLGEPLPGSCKVAVEGSDDKDQTLDLDGSAPVIFTVTPAEEKVSFELAFTDDDGVATSLTREFSTAQDGAAVILRSNKTFYRAGESATLEVLSSGTIDRVFIDLVRKNQTILTTTVSLTDGKGSYVQDLDAGLAGDLVFTAWFMARDGGFIRDSKVVFVEAGNGLSVKMTPEQDSYLPGDDAVIDVAVTDEAGKPVLASLGIQIVDEAVFALAEMKPGLLKLFFQLQEELMNPSWQILGAGNSFSGLIGQEYGAEPGSDADKTAQLNGEVLGVTMGDLGFSSKVSTSWAKNKDDLQTILLPILEGEFDTICAHMAFQLKSGIQDAEDLKNWLASEQLFYDPWGSQYQFEVKDEYWRVAVTPKTAGPDEMFGTWDDVSGFCEFYGGGDGMYLGDTGAGPLPPGEFPEEGEWDNGAVDDDAAAGGGDDKGEQSGGDGGNASIKVRKWFPETLFVEPFLVTGADGKASFEVPLADSITSWRMSAMASTKTGKLGGKDEPLLVFQEFFVDVDFPLYLTRGDKVSFPVVIYNYLEESQNIEIEVEPAAWFTILGDGVQNIELGAGEVKSILIPVEVTGVGNKALTVFGKGKKGVADAVMRSVEVRPGGKEFSQTEGARFKPADGEDKQIVTREAEFPESAIEGSQKLFLRVQPGFASQLISGMDSMLQLPNGCFEQTTSSAWPNVLVLKYLRDSGQLTPETEMKALDYINIGYQRILTFECASGGFNWWEGDDPGNAILGAIAVTMLRDTSEVYSAVDTKVIDRTAEWLGSVQLSNGSWTEESHLHAGNENLGAASVRATCYIAWSLAAGGFADSSTVAAAINYIKQELPKDEDLYSRALCANALAAGGGTGPLLSSVLAQLDQAAIDDEKGTHWSSEGSTLVNSWGNAADVELTALVALAFMNSGSYLNNVDGAVAWLAASRDPQGNWGYNTQATVLALKAMIGAGSSSNTATDADVTVRLNGEKLGERHFDNFNAQVLWQVDAPDGLTGKNIVELEYAGTGNLSWQLVYYWNQPWTAEQPGQKPLTIDIKYDKTTLATDDTVEARVTITAHDETITGTVLVDLGLPPAFSLHTEDLIVAKEQGLVSEFETTSKQILLYIDNLKVGQPRNIVYHLTALYPVTVEGGASKAYLYYNKDVYDEEPPSEFNVD